MKKLLAYLLLIPWAIRASFLKAYSETRSQGKFIYKTKQPEFFKTKIKAVADANRKATDTGITWHVIEPADDKFLAVSDKYLKSSGLKSIYQTV